MDVVGGEDDGDGCGRRGGDAMEKRENRGVDMTFDVVVIADCCCRCCCYYCCHNANFIVMYIFISNDLFIALHMCARSTELQR